MGHNLLYVLAFRPAKVQNRFPARRPGNHLICHDICPTGLFCYGLRSPRRDRSAGPPAAGCRSGATPPHPAPARAERLPRRRRPGGREGRSLPGPGVLRHRQRHPERGRGPRALDLRRAALEPLGQGVRPRPHGLRAAHAGPGGRSASGHGRPREVLQAGAPGSRPEVRDGGTAALGAPRHVPPACRQGAHRHGRRPRTSPPSKPQASRRTRRRL